MRIKTSFIIVFIIFIMAARGAVFAETPHEQLKQMVEQLQKNPSDNALREKIIKLAQEVKPAPAVPEEAERFEGRAQFAFKNAKSPADYLDAAKEYEKAIAAAPWVAGYYADLCTIYEKAEKYAEAKKSCEFFLASSPSAQDASDVRKRIAGLEFAIEKANSPEVRAAREREQERERRETLLRSLNGAVFVGEAQGGDAVYEIHINGSEVAWEMHYVHIDKGSGNELNRHYVGQVVTRRTQLTGLELTFTSQTGWKDYFEISPDGKTIKGNYGVVLRRR